MCKRKDRSSKWISNHKRWIIYHNNNYKCAYCGDTIISGKVFTLDHIIPIELGGTNKANNLVVACRNCNSSKEKRNLKDFLKYLEKQGVDISKIKYEIKNQLRKGRKLEKKEYKNLPSKEQTERLKTIICTLADRCITV